MHPALTTIVAIHGLPAPPVSRWSSSNATKLPFANHIEALLDQRGELNGCSSVTVRRKTRSTLYTAWRGWCQHYEIDEDARQQSLDLVHNSTLRPHIGTARCSTGRAHMHVLLQEGILQWSEAVEQLLEFASERLSWPWGQAIEKPRAVKCLQRPLDVSGARVRLSWSSKETANALQMHVNGSSNKSIAATLPARSPTDVKDKLRNLLQRFGSLQEAAHFFQHDR